jgi:hypothetical protein
MHSREPKQKDMAYLSDFVGFCLATFGLFAQSGPFALTLSILAGLVLAAICWFVAVNYTRLWNTRYRPGAIHYVLCGIAAFITLLSTVAYFALDHSQDAAKNQIEKWKNALKQNQAFTDREMIAAYWAEDKAGLVDRTVFPPPGTPQFQAKPQYPSGTEAGERIAAKIWAEAAVKNYQDNNPFLSSLILPVRKPADIWYADEKAYRTKNPGQLYYVENGLAAVAAAMRDDIAKQAQRLIPETRTALVLVFFFVQLVPFSLLGWAAYRDIKVMVHPSQT